LDVSIAPSPVVLAKMAAGAATDSTAVVDSTGAAVPRQQAVRVYKKEETSIYITSIPINNGSGCFIVELTC